MCIFCNTLCRGKFIVALAIILLFLTTNTSWGFKIATFNMEYFDLFGKIQYKDRDMAYLSNVIKKSGVDILALQEIEGEKTMRYFVTKYLKGWDYGGIDTKRKQDLFFLWKKSTISPVEKPFLELKDIKLNWKGDLKPLFSRPPLRGSFKHLDNGLRFTLIDVHLRGLGTRGRKDKISAITFNNVKRQAQAVELTRLSQKIEGPLFILGDYNSVKLKELRLDSLKLKEGHTFDKLKCTIDHINYKNIKPEKNWRLYEIETSIPWRSKRREHPDHDMLVLDMR